MQLFSDETFSTVKKVLDYSAKRQEVISNNLANIDTPKYKRMDVSFLEEFKEAVETGQNSKIEAVELKIDNPEVTATRNDGNNVDIDLEMGVLAKNGLLFKTFSTMIANKYRMLRETIQSRM